MTEVPGGQPLALPEPVWQTIADINTYLQDVRTNAQKLTTQEKTLQALAQIERLNQAQPKEDPSKSQHERDAELLEKVEGVGWSKFVFEEIEWRLEDARTDLISLAKQNSQWRSLIQTMFILMATISVGMVWVKLNSVAQKGML